MAITPEPEHFTILDVGPGNTMIEAQKTLRGGAISGAKLPEANRIEQSIRPHPLVGDDQAMGGSARSPVNPGIQTTPAQPLVGSNGPIRRLKGRLVGRPDRRR
jgi:hypothetical protein